MSETRERELVERLRRRHTCTMGAPPHSVVTVHHLVNPDGPEAADLIEALSASTQVEVMRDALEEATRCLTWIANLGYEGAPDIAMRKAARDSLAHIAVLSAQAKTTSP